MCFPPPKHPVELGMSLQAAEADNIRCVRQLSSYLSHNTNIGVITSTGHFRHFRRMLRRPPPPTRCRRPPR